MLNLGAAPVRNCGGMSRRAVLQVGAVGALGLTLSGALRTEATGATPISVLSVFLRGGLSHLDTWDMKPESTLADTRGEFRAIETSVSGIRFCELLPLLARQAHHLTVLRGASHREGEHDRAMQWVLTGQPANPAQVFPNPGAVLGRYRPGSSALPPAIHVQTLGLGTPWAPPAAASQPGLGAGFLGAAHQPFLIPDAEKISEMDWLQPAPALTGRLDRRRELMRALDGFARRGEEVGWQQHDSAFQRAFSMVTSPQAKQAFFLDREPAPLRDRYGRHEFGQSCLMGRRLIEAGVRYVQVNWSARGWEAITPKDDLFTRSTFDSHFGHFPWLRRQLPRLDQGLSALLEDLSLRGLLERTLVLVLTEFGRTAKVNGDAGRDHWQQAFSVLAAGGGLEGGRVLGATDATGQEIVEGRFEPEALVNSIYHLCGLDVAVQLRGAGIVKATSEGVPGLV